MHRTNNTRLSAKLRSTVLVIASAATITACSNAEQEALDQGKVIVDKNCKVCHAQGINGAPIIGNKKMWSKRAGQGIDVLVQHASEGYGLMPAKGGNQSLTDDDLRLAISYMLSELEK